MALLLLLDPNYQFVRASIQSASSFDCTLQVLKPLNTELTSSNSSVVCSTSIIRNPQSLLQSISSLDSSIQVDHQILTNIIGNSIQDDYVEVNHEIRVTTSSNSSATITTYITVDIHTNISGDGVVDGRVEATKQILSQTQGVGVADGRIENQVQLLTNIIGQADLQSSTSINKQINTLVIGIGSLDTRIEAYKELRTSDTASGDCQAYIDITPAAQYVYLNATCSSSSSLDCQSNIIKAINSIVLSDSVLTPNVSISHEIRVSAQGSSVVQVDIGITKYLNTLLQGSGSTSGYLNVVGEVPYRTFTKSVGVGRSNLIVYDKYEKRTSTTENLQVNSSNKTITVIPFDKTETI